MLPSRYLGPRKALGGKAPRREGPPGPPGKFPTATAWQEGVHYEGTVVTHGGGTWQAQRDTGREPPHEDWLCLAIPGSAGPAFLVRGTWNPTKS